MLVTANFEDRVVPTVDIEGKVRPAVVEIDLLISNLDLLDHTHCTRGRAEVLQTSCELDKASDKHHSEEPAETLVGPVAVSSDLGLLAIRVKAICVWDFSLVPCCVGLILVSNLCSQDLRHWYDLQC